MKRRKIKIIKEITILTINTAIECIKITRNSIRETVKEIKQQREYNAK